MDVESSKRSKSSLRSLSQSEKGWRDPPGTVVTNCIYYSSKCSQTRTAAASPCQKQPREAPASEMLSRHSDVLL